MGQEHIRRYYKFLSDVKERVYVPPHPNQIFKEGDICIIADSPTSNHHKVNGLKVKVLARYFTTNYGYRNYGMVVEVLNTLKKGKILHLPSIMSKEK